MNINFKNVAIIGVGLIGGSFALSLRKAGFNGKIVGIGRRRENLIKAKDLRVIDEYSTDPAEGVKDADLILLSTPVGQFPKIIKKAKGYIKKGAIVTDVGSVKQEVVETLESLMPEGVSFIGAHPIAGRECSGVESASHDLFKNTRCILTPSENTDKRALNKIINTWKAIGAQTILMHPEEHDAIFATVSHLPHVIAYVLINTILDLNKGLLSHCGRGLRDMTRIALSPPELWRDICVHNKTNIIKSLEHFLASTNSIKRLIENSEWDRLEKEFKKARAGRQSLESS
jgi:prephenate dehydrogenase